MTTYSRKNPDNDLLFIVIVVGYVLVVMMALSSCDASYHLQRAKAKGADVKVDTTWQDVTIISPEIKFGTVIRPDWQIHKIEKPFVAEDEKTGARTEVTIDLKDDCSPDCIDTVYIETTVPAREETKKVPVKTETKISAGYTRWDLIILAIAACAVGAVASRLLWR